MKLKLKAVVAAVAMGLLASQANAAIESGTTGNSELFFAAWSSSLQRSYYRDLGVNMNDFLFASNQGVATGGTTAALGTSNGGTLAFDGAGVPVSGGNVTNAGYSLSFQADASLMGWLGTGTAFASDVVWMVGAIDGTGTGQNGRRYLSTSSTAGTEGRIESLLTNANAVGMTTANQYMTANATLGTHPTLENGTSTATPGTLAYAPQGINNNWANFTSGVFDSTGVVGSAMEFFFITPSSTTSTARARADQYANAAGASTWTLSADGTLVYAAAIPVPAAVWLFGSGLLGLIGVARRRRLA